MVFVSLLIGLVVVTASTAAAVRWSRKPKQAPQAIAEVQPAATADHLQSGRVAAPSYVTAGKRVNYGGGYGSAYGGGYDYGNPNGEIILKDHVNSNTIVDNESLQVSLFDGKGEKVDLRSYRGKKNIVLVMTRGFPGYVCPVCSAQTSRLIMNYEEFAKRDTEVLVVFPSSRERLPEFMAACQSQASNSPVPFPILLDEDLKIVEQLGIKADLAKPSTFILDKKGQVRFAYVGSTVTDRPSVKAMLRQLDMIGGA